jgi:dTDP-4-amino-4,6-dideoxygalactose transaminase
MITSDFLTTVSLSQCTDSIKALTIFATQISKGRENEKLSEKLKSIFWTNTRVNTFYNARAALLHSIKSQNFKTWTEIIVSAYTCVSVSNAILQAWCIPIYADIETESLWIDASNIDSLISTNTWAIILQHTFWIPSRDRKIIASLARKKQLFLIVDAAHSLNIQDWEQEIIWDAAIFSSGRDKVISSVNWWFLVSKISWSLKTIDTETLNNLEIARNHLYNIIWYFAKITYKYKIWKICMFIANKLWLFPKIVSEDEYRSNEANIRYRLPNSLAKLLNNELEKIESYITKRRRLMKMYHENLSWYSILDKKMMGNAFRTVLIAKDSDDRENIFQFCKQYWVLLGQNWSWQNIVPKKTDLKKAMYMVWSCPVAENIAWRVLFLPCAYNQSDCDINTTISILQRYKNEL